MQQTTKIMFNHYMERNRALEVVWMRKRRIHILLGSYYFAIVKNYHLYSGDPSELIDRGLDYPSPLFDKARNKLHTGTHS